MVCGFKMLDVKSIYIIFNNMVKNNDSMSLRMYLVKDLSMVCKSTVVNI